MLKAVGKYSIIKLLGEGATSHVYLAKAPHIDYPLALKVFKTQDGHANAWVDGFKKEANLMYKLSGQPNIVPLMDVDISVEGYHFIVMPYYDSSLANLISRGIGLALGQVTDIIEQILTGLMVIHQHNLIHRDIKPANILLDKHQRVFLSDFGIAIDEVLLSKRSTAGRDIDTGVRDDKDKRKIDCSTIDIHAAGLVFKSLWSITSDKKSCQTASAIVEFIDNCVQAKQRTTYSDGFEALQAFQEALGEAHHQQEFTQKVDNQDSVKASAKAIMMMIRGVLIHSGELNKKDVKTLLSSDTFEQFYNSYTGSDKGSKQDSLNSLVALVRTQLNQEYPDWQNGGSDNSQRIKSKSSRSGQRIKPKKVFMFLLFVTVALVGVFILNSLMWRVQQSKSDNSLVSNDALSSKELSTTSSSQTVSKSLASFKDIAVWGKVLFEITPTDAVILLLDNNDQPVFINEAGEATIPYGQYQLRVSKNGYQTINQDWVLNQAKQIKRVDLVLSDSRYFIGNTDKTVADGIGVEFVLLPSRSSSPAAAASGSLENETVNKRIRMMSFEVTNELYGACVADGNCRNHQKISTDPRQDQFERLSHPVVNVSWYDVVEHFVPWLSQHTGSKLRLPTESEWVFAATAGSSQRFSWGDSMRENMAHCRDCNANSPRTTLPVKQFSANPWLLYDMHGNVQEWLGDCWQASIHTQARCDQAVVRGGSWLDGKSQLQLNARTYLNKRARSHTTGFRLVEEVN